MLVKTLLYLNSGGRLLWNAPSDEEVMLKRSIRIMTAINSFVILSKVGIPLTHCPYISSHLSEGTYSFFHITHHHTMFNNVYFQHTEDIIIITSFSVQRPWRPRRPLVQPPVNLLKIADSISSWYIDREKEAAYYYLLSTDGSSLIFGTSFPCGWCGPLFTQLRCGRSPDVRRRIT